MSVPWYPCWAISWEDPEHSPPLVETLLEHRLSNHWAIVPESSIHSEEQVWLCWLKTVDAELSGKQFARSVDVSMLCALHDTRRISDALDASAIIVQEKTVAWLLYIPVADSSLLDDLWHTSNLPFPKHSTEIEQAAHRLIEVLQAHIVPIRPGFPQKNHAP